MPGRAWRRRVRSFAFVLFCCSKASRRSLADLPHPPPFAFLFRPHFAFFAPRAYFYCPSFHWGVPSCRVLAPQVDQIGRNFTSKLYQPGVSILVSPPPCVCLPEPPHSMMDIKRERRVESESAGCVDGASPAPRTPSVYLADVVACERERESARTEHAIKPVTPA